MKTQFIFIGLALASLGAFAQGMETAPAFRLKGIDGASYEFAGPAHKGVVVINFFAAWCTTCEEEIPQLRKLQEIFPEASYLGIDAGESLNKTKRFVEKYHYPWRALLDEDKAILRKFNILGVPSTLVVGAKGEILYRGSRPPESLAPFFGKHH